MNYDSAAETPIYQGEPPEWDSRELKERARQLILWTVSTSYDHYRKFRNNCDEYFDLYTNQPLKLRPTSRVRSNVPSGRVSEMVDTYVADLMNQITKTRPVVGVIPEEPDDIDGANVLERLLQYDMDNWHPEMGYWPAMVSTVFQSCLWGSSPSKMVWEERIRREIMPGVIDPDTGIPLVTDQMGFQGAVVEPVFFYDAYPHPNKEWPNDHHPIVHITHQSYDRLLALKGVVYDDDVDLIPDRKDMGDMLGDFLEPFLAAVGDSYERADQRARLGWTSDTRLQPDGVLVAECECMLRPKIDWVDSYGRKHKGDQPVRTILTMANGVVIRVAPSPLRDGMSFWQNAKMNHIPGQWYGMGLVQKNRPQVAVEDTVLNMWLQNLAQTVNRPKVVSTQYLESGQSLDDQPGGVIRVRAGGDPRMVVSEMQMASVYNDVIGILRYIGARGEGVGGANELKQGRVPAGETTATESTMAFNQASLRFRFALAWLGATFVIPQARKAYQYNRDYLSMPYAFRVLGKTGAVHFQTIKESDFSTNVDFVFLGPTEMENENLRIAQLENYLKILSPFVQMGWAEPAIKEVMVLLADKFNIPNLDRLKELIGYGQPAPPPAVPGGEGAGAGQGGGGRTDRRLGSGGPPTGMQNLAKSLGGVLARGNMGRV